MNCDKCGAAALELDEEGDLQCWNCGYNSSRHEPTAAELEEIEHDRGRVPTTVIHDDEGNRLGTLRLERRRVLFNEYDEGYREPWQKRIGSRQDKRHRQVLDHLTRLGKK